jgi:transposase-like protein
VLEELLRAAWHHTEQYATNWIKADHGRVKARLRSMRGLKYDRNAGVVIAGHTLVRTFGEALRTGRRGTSAPAADRRIRRTRPDELILYVERCFSAPRPN